MPEALIPTLGLVATILEIGFGLALLLGIKTELVGKLSGVLLLVFALSMTFSVGIKQVFDYSVFVGAAAGFALGLMQDKYLELDTILFKEQRKKRKILQKDKVLIDTFLRITIAISFLSAVADRFGLWGRPGSRNVAWGDWSEFVNYTGKLNFWAPESLIPTLAIMATVLEITFALCFLLNWQTKKAAFGSGILLIIFILSMSLSGGAAVFLLTFGMSLYSFSAGSFYLSLPATKEK